MEFKEFERKPFRVEAVQISDDNLEDIAKLIGEVKTKDDKPYIVLDRRIVPNVSRAYVGWWLTRMNDNLRCYSDKVFVEQFELVSDTMIENVFANPQSGITTRGVNTTPY